VVLLHIQCIGGLFSQNNAGAVSYPIMKMSVNRA
jgi:hypothetical protein